MKIIKFYRSTGEYGFLSNLYPCNVIYGGIMHASSEHAYQFGKAKDGTVKGYIMNAPTPHLACIVGHGLFPWMVEDGWKEKKVPRMKAVLIAKFTQNKELKEKLLATGDAALIEDSNSDYFWGVGAKGTGKNMLGKLLMQVREEIRQGIQ